MQALATNISALHHSPLTIIQSDAAYFSSPLHFHPEFELVYITEGTGKRIIGSTVQDFQPGELVLIGPNVAHCWLPDTGYSGAGCNRPTQAIVLYFDPAIFSPVFYDMKESHSLKKLFIHAQCGLMVTGTAREDIRSQLLACQPAQHLNKMICLLEILKTLGSCTEMTFIDQHPVALQFGTSHRLTGLFEFIHQNLEKNITLTQAADLVSLTPPSFSRFFKQKTGKTFVDYLRQTRVSHASKSLLETDLTIAEIAHKNGFNTVPNFNRLFKKINGVTPTEYRNSLK